MKSEYDFSGATVGKFYRKGADIRLPDEDSDDRPDSDLLPATNSGAMAERPPAGCRRREERQPQ